MKLEIKENVVIKKELKKLDFYFSTYKKEIATFYAIQDGYKGTDIAEYLKMTKAAVSKIYKKLQKAGSKKLKSWVRVLLLTNNATIQKYNKKVFKCLVNQE